jgi:pyruvate kinase
MTKTKIVCTVGPASSRKSILLRMMDAGMDIMRLNFSHGTHTEHLRRIHLIRELNKKHRKRVRILGDLEGYRIRVGRMKDGKPLSVTKNQILWLTQEDVLGHGNIISFDYKGDLSEIRKGQHVYIDDGKIALSVASVGRKALKTWVLTPGLIKERKGINMPDTRLNFNGLTIKDKKDVDFCIRYNIDYIAQSFVRSQDDLLLLKEYLGQSSDKFKLIAKIENREGINNVDSILKVCDGIMIARGDMGISIPIYEVPIVQKRIIKKCNRAKKFVITATQMLESMTENLIPERSEVSDVANAIIDGSDYVMLSAETAVGLYPVESIDIMNKVIMFTERNIFSL